MCFSTFSYRVNICYKCPPCERSSSSSSYNRYGHRETAVAAGARPHRRQSSAVLSVRRFRSRMRRNCCGVVDGCRRSRRRRRRHGNEKKGQQRQLVARRNSHRNDVGHRVRPLGLGLRARMEQARQVHHRLVWLTALFFVFCFFHSPIPGRRPYATNCCNFL